MTRIFIATPTAGGNAPIAYAQSLVAATTAIHEVGGAYRYVSIDGADIVLARNILTHAFLEDSSCDHILFIDSDMAIDAAVFRQFLKTNGPIVGAIYSKRSLDLSRYAAAMQDRVDDRRARALASDFNVIMKPGAQTVADNLMEVAAFGFGCVLIHRSVFEALIGRKIVGHFNASQLKGLGITGTVFDFFGNAANATSEQMSEDYAFCARVRVLGDTPLLGYVGDGIGHVGSFTFSGPFIEQLTYKGSGNA